MSLPSLGLAAALALLAARPPQPVPPVGPASLRLLDEVRREVAAMGERPGEPFVQREFWIGEDEDDTNKSVHAVVLIQPGTEGDRLRIQVTEMDVSPGLPKVRTARRTRSLAARASPDGAWVVTENGFGEKELRDEILPGLLKAIQDKKRLLGKNR